MEDFLKPKSEPLFSSCCVNLFKNSVHSLWSSRVGGKAMLSTSQQALFT